MDWKEGWELVIANVGEGNSDLVGISLAFCLGRFVHQSIATLLW